VGSPLRGKKMTLGRTIARLFVVSALCVVMLSTASTSGAATIPVRTGSAYGGNTDFGTCESNIVNFLNDPNGIASNCEGFVSGVFTIGASTYTGDQFVFLSPGGTDFGVLDILQLNGSSLVLPLANFTLPTGVFVCGGSGDPDDTSAAHDSVNPDVPMTGLSCTSGATTAFSGTQDVSGVTMTFSLNGVTFTNGGNLPLSVFTTDGNILGATFTPDAATVATPEPGTLMLLGTGIAALVGLRRRKQ